MEEGWKEVAEYGFDSDVKRMSVVFEAPDGKQHIFTKGAVERVLNLCVDVGTGEHRQEMNDEMREQITQQMTILADQGLVSLPCA
jgi:magnesium-transporting ATPase (P-type)